jgi:hypothetical protein
MSCFNKKTNRRIRVLLLIGLFVHLVVILQAQKTSFDPGRKYHPDSLRSLTTSVMDEVSAKHPGFYRYTSKSAFDFLIDSTNRAIKDSLTELEYYRKIKPLFAQIGCLHTSVTLSAEYYQHLDKTQTLLPLEVFIRNDKRVFITKNHSGNPEVPIKGQLLSINDQSIDEILNQLFKSVPSDGYNETLKFLALNHQFSLWYQTIIEVTENFKVEILTKDGIVTANLKGVSKGFFPTVESIETAGKQQLGFVVRDGAGVLTIHSFAKSVVKKNGQNFRKYIKTVFKQMKDNNIEKLVIDLRYNTGGTDGNAGLLASYFFDKPFRYWDKIEVTEAVAKEIKGLNRIFYKKPRKVEDSYRWRKTWITKEFDYYEVQNPSKYNFRGKVYIITNGLCVSSCSDFVSVLLHNNKATVVGQETGGGFQGNTSGMMPETTIPTGLVITVPLLKYTNAVDLSKNFGRGARPNYEITPTVENWINKDDVEMEYVFKLIRK